MNRITLINNKMQKLTREPLKVTVTGAAGNIGYALVFMIAQGRLLGPDQPIELCLLEIPPMAQAVKGVEMELLDCAQPLITKIVATTDPSIGFKNCDVALLVGAKPRGPGMKRKDLLEANAKIFQRQAKDLDTYANENVKVCVVGNPANTNACIIAENSKRIKKENITALTRLDQNRTLGQVACKLGIPVRNVRNAVIWGNHSLTQFPDLQICDANLNGSLVKVREHVNSDSWYLEELIPRVQKRGKEIIEMRKSSSAASAANAICDHVRSWVRGTVEGEVVSMAVWSTNNCYGIASGLIFSFPVTCKNGKWEIVKDLDTTSKFNVDMLKKTQDELINEKKTALDFLKNN